jgi:hypothetical protein
LFRCKDTRALASPAFAFSKGNEVLPKDKACNTCFSVFLACAVLQDRFLAWVLPWMLARVGKSNESSDGVLRMAHHSAMHVTKGG